MGCGGSKSAAASAPETAPHHAGHAADSVPAKQAAPAALASGAKQSVAASSSAAVVAAVDVSTTGGKQAAKTKVLIVYYSTYGHIKKVCRSQGQAVLVDSHCASVIFSSPRKLLQELKRMPMLKSPLDKPPKHFPKKVSFAAGVLVCLLGQIRCQR